MFAGLRAAAVYFYVLVIGATPVYAETILGVQQQVHRLNPELNSGRSAYTAADCFNAEHCLELLVAEVGRAGGHIGKLPRSLGNVVPDLAGEDHRYSFAPPAGEGFCKAVLIKLSIAPTFGEAAPELDLSASRASVKAVVRLPKPANASARAWFDGVLILLSVADPDHAGCTLTDETREVKCKGGKCETMRF